MFPFLLITFKDRVSAGFNQVNLRLFNSTSICITFIGFSCRPFPPDSFPIFYSGCHGAPSESTHLLSLSQPQLPGFLLRLVHLLHLLLLLLYLTRLHGLHWGKHRLLLGDDALGLAPELGHQRRDVAAHEGLHAGPGVGQVVGEALLRRGSRRRRWHRHRCHRRRSGGILDRGSKRGGGGGVWGERFLRLGLACDRDGDGNVFPGGLGCSVVAKVIGDGVIAALPVRLLDLLWLLLLLSFCGLVAAIPLFGRADGKVAVDVLGEHVVGLVHVGGERRRVEQLQRLLGHGGGGARSGARSGARHGLLFVALP